jgi:hypothetical protein
LPSTVNLSAGMGVRSCVMAGFPGGCECPAGRSAWRRRTRGRRGGRQAVRPLPNGLRGGSRPAAGSMPKLACRFTRCFIGGVSWYKPGAVNPPCLPVPCLCFNFYLSCIFFEIRDAFSINSPLGAHHFVVSWCYTPWVRA